MYTYTSYYNVVVKRRFIVCRHCSFGVDIYIDIDIPTQFVYRTIIIIIIIMYTDILNKIPV